MEDPQFYKCYLKSNSNASLREPQQQELIELICTSHDDVSNDPPSFNHAEQTPAVAIFTESMKTRVRTATDLPLSDLKSPFQP